MEEKSVVRDYEVVDALIVKHVTKLAPTASTVVTPRATAIPIVQIQRPLL